MAPDRLPLAIIGGGRVGRTLGRIWRQAGWPVMAVTARELEHAEEAAQFIGTNASTDNAAIARLAEVLVVTTSDDAVEPTVGELAASGAIRPEHVVLHTSGALQLTALAAAAGAGASVGSIHPMHSFAAPEPDGSRLAGIVWGVTAESGAVAVARELVRDAGGEPVMVDDADRPVYHAAAAIASNATVGVIGFAVALLKSCGFADDIAERALVPLARETLANVEEMGIVDALTGPVVRGDVATVAKHLAALAELDEAAAERYRVLSGLVLDIARRRQTPGSSESEALSRLLEADGPA